MDFTATPRRLLARLQRMADLALSLLQNRLELLGNELQQELLRAFDALVRGAAGLLLLGFGVFFLAAFFVVLFWDGYRLIALGGASALFLLAGVWLLRDARARLQPQGGPLAASLAELVRDREHLARANPESGDAPPP